MTLLCLYKAKRRDCRFFCSFHAAAASGPIPFCAVLPDQVENLHRGDAMFPFWPQGRWKLVCHFVSSHALDTNSYVENKQTKKPQTNPNHQVGKTGSLKPLEDDSALCAAPGVAFVQEVVDGFDFLLPRDDGRIILGT